VIGNAGLTVANDHLNNCGTTPSWAPNVLESRLWAELCRHFAKPVKSLQTTMNVSILR